MNKNTVENTSLAMRTLKKLIGLTNIKIEIKQFRANVKMHIMHNDITQLKPSFLYAHRAFIGNPGTGKFLVAKLLGRIYWELGLLPRGHIIAITSPTKFIGQQIGETASKVNEAVDKALGGILFIREAHQLGESKLSGQFYSEAMKTLLSRMENEQGKFITVLAGSQREMEAFLTYNCGTIPTITSSLFPDYIPEELMLILKRLLKNAKLNFTEEMELALRQTVTGLYNQREDRFGNMRVIRKLIYGLLKTQAVRLKANNLPRNSPLLPEDIQGIFAEAREAEQIFQDTISATNTLRQLNTLIGQKKVKAQLTNIYHSIKLLQESKEKEERPYYLSPLVFLAKPGSGKSIVAKLVGGLYHDLGILRRGHMIELSSPLKIIDNYLNDIPQFINEIIDSAMDGVLLIDEANLFMDSTGNEEYYREALEIIISHIDKYRDRLLVIFAGYPEKMERFLNNNENVRSRIQEIISFENYDDQELIRLLCAAARKEGLKIEHDATEKVQKYLNMEKNVNPQTFGNAKSVKNLFKKMKVAMYIRLSLMKKNVNKNDMLLTSLDVPDYGRNTSYIDMLP